MFFCQLLPRVARVHVFANSGDFCVQPHCIAVGGEAIQLPTSITLLPSTATTTSIDTSIDTTIDTSIDNTTQDNNNNKWYLLKVSFRLNTSQNNISFEDAFNKNTTSTTKHTLNLDSFSIACKACNTQLCPAANNSTANTTPFKRVISLPSEFWMEALDCWACHHEDYASTLKGQQGGVIQPQQDVLMSANGYWLLHALNVNPANICLKYTGNESMLRSIRWINLHCINCDANIGQGMMPPQSSSNDLDQTATTTCISSSSSCSGISANSQQQQQQQQQQCGNKENIQSDNQTQMEEDYNVSRLTSIKLCKYTTRAAATNNHVSLPSEMNSAASVCFKQELMDSCNAHANYRILLSPTTPTSGNTTTSTPPPQQQPMMCVWVLNWNISIISNMKNYCNYNQSDGFKQQQEELQRCCKILYSDDAKHVQEWLADPLVVEASSAFGSGGGGLSFEKFSVICEILRAGKDQHPSLVPPPILQGFNGWNVCII